MSRLIVHTGTGTIVDAVVVDLDEDGETCDLCGDSEEIEGGLCAACFGAAPVGVWFSRCGVAVDTHEQILRAISGALLRHRDKDVSDGETVDMVCELLGVAGLDPFEDVQTNFLTDLRRDAARWNAFMNGPEYVRRRVPFIVCASCDNVGNETMVNPLVAAVVPWDVMGDPRAFAFVCDECASGSAVVL
jgi:hypothetical protein